MSIGIEEKSVGALIAEKISDFSEASKKTYILNEISIYGTSDKDGSSTLSFEWMGEHSPLNMEQNYFYRDMIAFFNKIKQIIIETKKEVKEQEPISITEMDGLVRILYRIKAWNLDGDYESGYKKPVEN